jgi:large subunit ribosomal protein L4
MKAKVIDLANKASGNVELDETVFGLEIRKDILARAVNWQLAKRRAGTHKTKGRSEISMTTKKSGPQKGSGGARHGARSAHIFRGGGTVFGPVVRSHAHALPKKVRKLALKTALSAKLASGDLIVMNELSHESGKTKDLKSQLAGLDLSSALFIGGTEVDANFSRAASNLIGIDVLPEQGANVYDILRRDKLVLTKDAVVALEARLK